MGISFKKKKPNEVTPQEINLTGSISHFNLNITKYSCIVDKPILAGKRLPDGDE